ncbi:hypothetical protein C8Q74DRAFT_1365723 [Fomes fomentarius]|nr:hypothetical protein C8Q74DRAFT_1365723 [Fomes fomentarius]
MKIQLVGAVASFCLLYYDYILTLPNEIQVIWRAPLNLANVLCLCIRYNFLVQITLTFFHNFHFTKGAGPDLSTQTCRTVIDFLAVFNVVNFSFVSAFVAMRMFAIYGRNWRLGILVFVLGCLSPCSIPLTMSWEFETARTPWPLPPCLMIIEDGAMNTLAMRYLPIAFSAINIVYESLCLCLTAGKTLSLYKEQRALGVPTTLTALLLRDGSLYFGTLFVLSISNILSATTFEWILNGWQMNTDIARALVPILTTRFIVHLRQATRGDAAHACLPSTRGTQTLAFARGRLLDSVSGNMEFND